MSSDDCLKLVYETLPKEFSREHPYSTITNQVQTVLYDGSNPVALSAFLIYGQKAARVNMRDAALENFLVMLSNRGVGECDVHDNVEYQFYEHGMCRCPPSPHISNHG
jgi:hypothetical protein